MKDAVLFVGNGEHRRVSAEEIKDGIYSRYEEFVDPKYEEFKVQYVKGAKNSGGPYFRLYFSYEEYKKKFPDRADRYEIVANMRRYRESKWHRKWKENLSDFCSIEKYIKNPTTDKWKYADAFYDVTQTCIEFQHSYINWDFEERNEFYTSLSINTVWLYDLPNANTRQNEDGNIEILEDNARGFFRISENPENLEKYRVYIQVKSGEIYRVNELLRHSSSTDRKSTIRYFHPTEIYTEEEFINAIKNNSIGQYESQSSETPKTIQELWNKNYTSMIVENIENGDVIQINRNQYDETFRDYSTGCIKYIYVDDKFGYNQSFEEKKQYRLSHEKEKRAIWILRYFRIKQV